MADEVRRSAIRKDSSSGIGPQPSLAPLVDGQDGSVTNPAAQPMYGLQDVGTTGLKISGGYLVEEFLNELNGVRGRQVYQQMSEGDAVIGAFLFALRQMLGKLDWHWEPPADPTPIEQASADFVQECWDDMSDSFDSVLEDVLTMATYGWSFFEVVYKIRGGEDPECPSYIDPATFDPGSYRSKFDDFRIGWRRFAPRAQQTLNRWHRGPNGNIIGMHQFDPFAENPSGPVFIPLKKALLFRIGSTKGSPEGRSMLRTAYRPWYFKTRIEEYEAIGIERELAGYPVVTTPAEWHQQNASAVDRQSLGTATQLARTLRRGESEGAVIPALYDSSGNKLFSIELITSGGARQIDIDAVITRKNVEIAMSVLADFLMLGHEDNGSRSLGQTKVDLWSLSVSAIAKTVAEVLNQHAVPKLLKLNGFKPPRLPELVFGEISSVDLAALGPFLKVLLDGGIITNDESTEDWARKILNMPNRDIDPLLVPDDDSTDSTQSMYVDPAITA